MPNEKEGNNPGQHDQPTKGWHNQGRQARNQRRHGNRGADQQRGRQARFEGREPRLQGHIYDWTGEQTPARYIRTTREISTYVGVVYTKCTADFTAAVEQEYTKFRCGLYNLVMGQCSEVLKERLKSHEDFLDANQNGIALLTLIRSLLHTFEERRKLGDGLSDVKMAFYKLRQGKYMKLERYHELFLAQVEVLDEVGVTIPDTALIQQVAEQHGRGVPTAADRQKRNRSP